MSQAEYGCWSCGKDLPAINTRCGDCNEPAIARHPKPKYLLPYCGMVVNTKELPAEGPFWRQCCSCHELIKWDDIDHYLIGPCPNCDTWGMFGAVEER